MIGQIYSDANAFKTVLKSQIKCRKLLKRQRKLTETLRKKTMVQLKHTVSRVAPVKITKKRSKSLKNPRVVTADAVAAIKTYRRIIKTIKKNGASQKATPWRSVQHYVLKDGEDWINKWAYALKKPIKETPTFDFPLLELKN